MILVASVMSNIDNICHHRHTIWMASLNISMPEATRKFVLERARQTSHATPTEYIRTLIREDQKRAELGRLDELLLAGLASGVEAELTPAYLKRLKERMRKSADKGARGARKRKS